MSDGQAVGEDSGLTDRQSPGEDSDLTDRQAAVRIAELAAQKGGRIYYVGGLVRDALLAGQNKKEYIEGKASSEKECIERDVSSKDVDIEVHGIAPQDLFELLKEVGEPLQYGSSFGVYGLKGLGIDIAMPRKEHATGRGHRDFEVFVDPFIGPREAARRRDFTINAMMRDVLTGELLDPYGGAEDLKNGVLRCVDPKSFAEDPLRVLRCAQFAARFGFSVEADTLALCRTIDITTLSRERVEEELKKALLKSSTPSVFFEVLRQMDQLDPWFSELKSLMGLEQDPVFHPEGDVWTHTMQVLDRAAALRERTARPYAYMLLALTHDLGKIEATSFEKGRIHAYGHEKLGLPIIETFLRRITGDEKVIKYVLNMAELHMKPNMEAYSRAAVKSTNKMFDQAEEPEDLIYMAMADKPVMSGSVPFEGDSDFLFDRLKTYRQTMAEPFVSGKDLVEAGLRPGEEFSELLEYAHKLRLAGIDKQTALKQVLSYKGKKK